MKYYVVWKGVKPGIYDNWKECEQQVKGVKGAVYKSFKTREEAEKAFNSDYKNYVVLGRKQKSNTNEEAGKDATSKSKPIEEALAVDAACSGNPGPMEYRGVYVKTGKQIFHQGVFQDATNNIGEFLAIVHALSLLHKKNSEMPIYSDSQVAINWVKQKKCKTTIKPTERNKKVFELIRRAEKWLEEHTYKNPILKWDTKHWGEIPADFGRKK